MRMLTKLAMVSIALIAGPLWSATVFADVVWGTPPQQPDRMCIGFDCVRNETFGEDTLRLKENNLRIHLIDTSTTSGHATTDWWIIANESVNGGQNLFAFSDNDLLRIVDVPFGEYIATSVSWSPFHTGSSLALLSVNGSTLYLEKSPSGEVTCASSTFPTFGGTPVACPETLPVSRSFPDDLDFIVDPGSNRFSITPDAVLAGGDATQARRLSNVAAGSDASDAAIVQQLDEVKATLTAVEALGDAPIAGTAELKTSMSAAEATQGTMGTEITAIETAIATNSTRIAGNTQAIAMVTTKVADNEKLLTTSRYVSTGDTPNNAGEAATATGSGSTAAGISASARTHDTAIGYRATVTADGSVAAGAASRVESANSVAVGADSTVTANAEGGVAIGQNARVENGAEDAVAIGRNTVADESRTVSVGSATRQRRITNVAAAQQESDLINVAQMTAFVSSIQSQLTALEQRIDRTDDQQQESGALMMAFSALVPNVRAGGDTQLSLGVGTYEGVNAMAVGVFHYFSDSVLFNLGISDTFNFNSAEMQVRLTWNF